jgi:hypothetical protein
MTTYLYFKNLYELTFERGAPFLGENRVFMATLWSSTRFGRYTGKQMDIYYTL